jgi:Peptidase family C25/Propeptide_C25
MTRRMMFYITAVCLILSTPLLAETVQLQSDGSLTVSVDFGTPAISKNIIYPLDAADGLTVVRVNLDGVRSAGHPGEPVLPVKPMVVLIPQDQWLVDVEVSGSLPSEIFLDEPVSPGQYQVPLSFKGPFLDREPNAEIYSNGNVFPASLVDTVNAHYCRGYKLAAFNLRPVQYYPAEGKLVSYSSLTARIITAPGPATAPDIVRCRGLEVDREWVRSKVSNPELVDSYRAVAGSVNSPLSNQRDNYPYVIVTQDWLEGSFAPMVTHKQSKGYPSTIVNMTWVQANYSGVDWAEQLRNFITDAYNNWNLQFCLLGGDDDKSDSGGESGDYVVPRRDCWSDTDYGENDDMPCDMYFACLDGNFNNDGDSRWGEPTDGIGGQDIDWFGEVHIGRACVDSTQEAADFVSFVISYENTDPDLPHMKKAYMLGELLWSDPTYGGDYKDEIRYGASTHGYTTVGFPPEWTVSTLYDRDMSGSWDSSDLYPILNSNDVHVINHLGHSDVDYCMRIYNSNVDNSVNNTVGFLAYSQGCYDGSFDDRGTYSMTSTDCILEHFTTQNKGAFAFVGNSRYGWGDHGTTNGSSQYYDRQFFDAIFGEEIVELGAANQDSKEDNIGFLNYGANRWCAYELNLFGDPQTPLGGGLSRVGVIGIDRTLYGDGVDMEIIVRDLDLDQNSGVIDTVDITVTSESGDSEVVTLTETGFATAVCMGTITVVSGSSSPGNGMLDCQHADQLTATYIDEDDGYGGYNIPRTATASADFMIPVISNVNLDSVSDYSADISFDTNESCVGTILYGTVIPPVMEQDGEGSGTSHTVHLLGLQDCTAYIYAVKAEDPAGNIVIDDNNGSYYQFTTWERVILMNETLDTNPGWSCGTQWAWGHPTGGSGDHGAPDPTNGYTGSNVYGYNLSGGYTNNISSTRYLTTDAIDCSGGTGTILGFYGWLGVETREYDEANIQISNNGSTWSNIWLNDETLDGGAWTWWEFDISAYADGHSSVYIRWGLAPTDAGWTYCGWNIDDIEISYSQPCEPAVTPTPAPTYTPAPPTATPQPPTPTTPPEPTWTPGPNTPTAEPTDTPPPQPTNTPIPPTPTTPPSEPTNTPLPTATPTVAPTNTAIPSYTPAPTNTPYPTNTPIPTSTPYPTYTPTTPPSEPTYTPIPTNTPEPPPTATPTEPAGDVSIDLILNQEVFVAGDDFLLTCLCTNPGAEIAADEYIILDVFGLYFFWPSWAPLPDYRTVEMPAGSSDTQTILSFVWPEGQFGDVSGIYFWAALIDPSTQTLIGNYDMVEFGYR